MCCSGDWRDWSFVRLGRCAGEVLGEGLARGGDVETNNRLGKRAANAIAADPPDAGVGAGCALAICVVRVGCGSGMTIRTSSSVLLLGRWSGQEIKKWHDPSLCHSEGYVGWGRATVKMTWNDGGIERLLGKTVREV